MTQNNLNLSTCPHCGNGPLYQLGDGRYKCGSCLRKFSPAGRRSRLTVEAMEAIISGFASGSPALSVATETGLNPKTVQLYYGRIRELLAAERERYLARRYGSAEVSPELFASSDFVAKWQGAVLIGCLVARSSEMELLFVSETGDDAVARLEPSAVAGWLVAADRRAIENLQLDRINCLAESRTRERARTFWTNTKRRLSAYCGGFRKHFRLYLREMEFRDNMGNTPEAREHIGSLLDRYTTTSKGENDA